jgi:hypothetical protein
VGTRGPFWLSRVDDRGKRRGIVAEKTRMRGINMVMALLQDLLTWAEASCIGTKALIMRLSDVGDSVCKGCTCTCVCTWI